MGISRIPPVLLSAFVFRSFADATAKLACGCTLACSLFIDKLFSLALLDIVVCHSAKNVSHLMPFQLYLPP